MFQGIGEHIIDSIAKDTLDVHVVLQRQVLVFQQVQKTVEVQQVQYTGIKPTLRISISTTTPSPRTLKSTFLFARTQTSSVQHIDGIIKVPVPQIQEQVVEVVKNIP